MKNLYANVETVEQELAAPNAPSPSKPTTPSSPRFWQTIHRLLKTCGAEQDSTSHLLVEVA